MCLDKQVLQNSCYHFILKTAKEIKTQFYTGYDLNAKHGLSEGDFGETDIQYEPYLKGLDTRIATRGAFSSLSSFVSKRFVHKRSCKDTVSGFIRGVNAESNLIFLTKNFPVTLSWDSNLIDTKCVYNSFFHRDKLSTKPNYNEQLRVYLRDSHGKMVITKDWLEKFKSPYTKISQDGDTLVCVILYLLDKSKTAMESVSTEDVFIENAFELSPNPALSNLFVKLNTELFAKKYRIYSSNGGLLANESFLEMNFTFNVDVANYPKGIYLLRIDFDDGTSAIKRFVKIE